MMRYTPTPKQSEVIDSIVNNPSGGTLFAGQMGVGKTLVAVESIRAMKAERVLIICPKSTFGYADRGHFDGWLGTFKRQHPKMNVSFVKKRSDVTNDDGAFIIGREMVAAITKDTTKERGVNWKRVRPFDMVVYDEVHFIGNRKSKAFTTALTIPAQNRLALSGTPFRTKFENIWAVSRFCWPNKTDIISKSFWTWSYLWCNAKTEHFGARKVTKITGEKSPGEFVKTLPNYQRLTAPSKAVNKTLRVQLTPQQRRAYSEMEESSIAWLNEHEATIAALPIVKRIRLREMTLGLPDIKDDEIFFPNDCSSSKLDAVQDFLKTHTEPLLIFTHSEKFARVAAHRLKAALWTGKINDRDRAKAKQDFLTGKKQILVATPRSFGTGTDGLQHVCDTMIFLSRDDSDTDNLQAIARLDRKGQKSDNVSVIDIIADNTYDEGDLSNEALAVLNMHKSLADVN